MGIGDFALGAGAIAGGLRRREIEDREDRLEEERIARQKERHGLAIRAGEQQMRFRQSAENRARTTHEQAIEQYEYGKSRRGHAEKVADAELAAAQYQATTNRLNAEFAEYVQESRKAAGVAQNEVALRQAALASRALRRQLESHTGVEIYGAYKRGGGKAAAELLNGIDMYSINNAADVVEFKSDSGREMLRVVDPEGVTVIDPNTGVPMVFDKEEMEVRYSGPGGIQSVGGRNYWVPQDGSPPVALTKGDGTPWTVDQGFYSSLLGGHVDRDKALKLASEYVAAAKAADPTTNTEDAFNEWARSVGLRAAKEPRYLKVPKDYPGAVKRKDTKTGEVVHVIDVNAILAGEEYQPGSSPGKTATPPAKPAARAPSPAPAAPPPAPTPPPAPGEPAGAEQAPVMEVPPMAGLRPSAERASDTFSPQSPTSVDLENRRDARRRIGPRVAAAEQEMEERRIARLRDDAKKFISKFNEFQKRDWWNRHKSWLSEEDPRLYKQLKKHMNSKKHRDKLAKEQSARSLGAGAE